MKNNFFIFQILYFWLKKRSPIFEIYLKGKTVLDIGCGEGELLEKDSKNFYGIDINSDALQRCLDKGLNVLEADVSRVPFEDNFFDVVHCKNVIEHLDPIQARQMLAEIKRVLKIGGLLILISPMPNTVWNTFGHIKPYPPMAIRKLFREKSLESFDSVLGLKIKNTFYFGRWSLNKITFLISSIIANIFTKSAGLYLMTIEKTKIGR